MRPKTTINRGSGEGETLEEEPPDFRPRCEKVAADFLGGHGESIYALVGTYMVRKTGELDSNAGVRTTLEALKYTRIKPDQLHDVRALTGGWLMRAAYLAGHKTLAVTPLYEWDEDALSEAAKTALKLLGVKNGRPADDVTQRFYDDLLELWLLAGKQYPPNPSASSLIKQEPEFHRFAHAAMRLTGPGEVKNDHYHHIFTSIKMRQPG